MKRQNRLLARNRATFWKQNKTKNQSCCNCCCTLSSCLCRHTSGEDGGSLRQGGGVRSGWRQFWVVVCVSNIPQHESSIEWTHCVKSGVHRASSTPVIRTGKPFYSCAVFKRLNVEGFSTVYLLHSAYIYYNCIVVQICSVNLKPFVPCRSLLRATIWVNQQRVWQLPRQAEEMSPSRSPMSPITTA